MVARFAIAACAILLGSAANALPTVDEDPVLSGLRACAPTHYGAAIQCLDRVVPAADRAAYAERDGTMRFFIGIFIMNNWGLSTGSGPLYDQMRALGFAEPAEMTEAIFEGYAARYRDPSPAPGNQATSGDRR